MSWIRTLAIAACCVWLPVTAAAQSAANVLLVINDQSPASVQIGEHYAAVRHLAADHVMRITAPMADVISRAEYERTIEAPVASWLTGHGLQDEILYVVLTKDVPLRIAGTEGRDGTRASVDSELTLLYRRMIGAAPVLLGQVDNPYYLGDASITQARPFGHVTYDIYLVTRLDGYSVDDVLHLIDRSVAPATTGRIVLDARAAPADSIGDQWLSAAADRIRQVPGSDADRALLETTRQSAVTNDAVMGYASWGSNDLANRQRHLSLRFANGAVATTFVSSDGRTFREPPPEWLPGVPEKPLAASTDSLVGDLIRDGVSGVSANVTEPYFDAMVRPQILFPAYLSGMTLGEAFYLSMPYLSWQSIVIGDPLCTPFPRPAVAADQLSKGVDPDTELPALFSARRAALITKTGISLEAAKLSLKAEVRLRSGDRTEAKLLLARAVSTDRRFIGAAFVLGSLYEQDAAYDDAIGVYRGILTVDASNVVALNNLAYALAVHKAQPRDAVAYAERAYQLAHVPDIADTLGWIYHLMGDDRRAQALVEEASTAARDSAEVQLHAAFVHAALGQRDKAQVELAAAMKLDPNLITREDVKALRERIKDS